MPDVLSIDELTGRSAELRRLRWEAMARGEFSEVMDTEEAAYFCRMSVDTLLESDAPRSVPPGRGKGKHRHAKFLKPQLIAWLARYLTYDATEQHRVRTPRRMSA
jgi:hypothetical protein